MRKKKFLNIFEIEHYMPMLLFCTFRYVRLKHHHHIFVTVLITKYDLFLLFNQAFKRVIAISIGKGEGKSEFHKILKS